jgi:hypothetical protein
VLASADAHPQRLTKPSGDEQALNRYDDRPRSDAVRILRNEGGVHSAILAQGRCICKARMHMHTFGASTAALTVSAGP